MWAFEEAACFARPRLKRGAKARAKGKALPRKPVKARMSAHATGRALDRLMTTTVGVGLEDFKQLDGDHLVRIDQRRLLVVHMDEGSPSYALSWYLQYHERLRSLFIRDNYHREWDDVTLSLRKEGLWPTMLLSQLVFNLAHGPWEGAGWCEKIIQGAKSLIGTAPDGGELMPPTL